MTWPVLGAAEGSVDQRVLGDRAQKAVIVAVASQPVGDLAAQIGADADGDQLDAAGTVPALRGALVEQGQQLVDV